MGRVRWGSGAGIGGGGISTKSRSRIDWCPSSRFDFSLFLRIYFPVFDCLLVVVDNSRVGLRMKNMEFLLF